MDENTLRFLLADALTEEPPIGPVARNALHAGIRIRRRRTTGTVGGVAVIAAIVGLIPVVGGLPFSGPAPVSATGHGIGGHNDHPVELAFSPNGKILATADSDGTARLWSVATQRQIGAPIKLPFQVHINAVAYSPDGKVLATGDADGQVRLWNIATRRQVRSAIQASTGAANGGVLGVAFSPDGQTVATVSADGTAGLWDVVNRNGIGRTWTIGGGPVLAVAFSPNGKLLLTTGSNFTARLWNVSSLRPVGKPIGRAGHDAVNAAVFSPDGNLIGTGGIGRGQDRLWSVATQNQVGKTMQTGSSGSYGLAFTPDSKVLVTANTDGTIEQWSVATSLRVRHSVIRPASHPQFEMVVISPDGTLLATTQHGGDAHLWVLSTA
ncbi:MAG TPA: WD40 repeat domain-containing protein [Streptosporangiaceae bacterium]|nr:WD40 repeat domain-containing protein [Streptosporangiaceae bacterium]